jgi:hypothetical protein
LAGNGAKDLDAVRCSLLPLPDQDLKTAADPTRRVFYFKDGPRPLA